MMRIVEALEGKGCRLPLMKGEVELAEKLAAIIRQVCESLVVVARVLYWAAFSDITTFCSLRGLGQIFQGESKIY